MKPHPALNLISRIALISIILAQSGPISFAENAVAHEYSVHPAQPASLTFSAVLGDFDGDQRIDQAELHVVGGHRCIRVRFADSRETHLELVASIHTPGALLTRDINRDQKADLIWVHRFHSEPPEAWLGDGLGRFAKADDETAAAGFRALLFGDSSPALTGDISEERSFLAPEPVSTDLTNPGRLVDHMPSALLISWRDVAHALELRLSSLRERGPPMYFSFV